MIATDGNQITSGVSAREAHSSRSSIRAVLAELDHLRGTNQVEELLCRRDLNSCRSSEIASVGQFGPHRLDDGGIGVTEPDRSIAHAELYEFVPIDIPDVRTESACNESRREDRVLIVPLRVRVTPAGNQFTGATS